MQDASDRQRSRISDAHDRRPKPRPKPKPKGGNSILGFIESAAGAVKRQVTSDVKGAAKVYKAIDRNVEANIPGTSAWGRRRSYERKMAMRGRPVRNELKLSPNAIASIIEAGEGLLQLPKGMRHLRGGEGIDRMLEGSPLLWGPPPKRPGTWGRIKLHQPRVEEQGYDYRTPMLISQRYGNPLFGPRGGVHADLGREVTVRQGEEMTRYPPGWHQGWITQPYEDMIGIELGHGPFVGYPKPQNTRGIENMLRYVTRDFTDDLIRGRLNEPKPLSSIGDEALERLLKDLRKRRRR